MTLITLVIDTLAGYAFARLRFPGRTALFALVLATLMIPTAASIAPLYIMVSHAARLDARRRQHAIRA